MKKYKLIIIVIAICFCNYSIAQQDTINVSDIPTISLSENDLESEFQNNDISGLLQSSQDTYINKSGYNFGQARYKIRGYDNNNSLVLLNGILVNDAENGRPYYYTWGGLNDITRFKTSTMGLNFSDFSFGGIGGVTNISLIPSSFRKGVSISYANSNQSYAHRVMATYSSGLSEKGWAFTTSLSTRLSPTNNPLSFSEGTFYEGYAFFASAEKKINNSHSLILTGFASPSRSARSAAAIQEAYDLTGSNYYNPN
ncbi:MAG: TonB-dependent receptor plug domain-containing protein [Bacteroidales bacterium]|jgi:hypothetical protein|nr:TonB-dependent receptor plug domain-containing protein [Bacteroidales bacterium]